VVVVGVAGGERKEGMRIDRLPVVVVVRHPRRCVRFDSKTVVLDDHDSASLDPNRMTLTSTWTARKARATTSCPPLVPPRSSPHPPPLLWTVEDY
jgi:hypothetical protein